MRLIRNFLRIGPRRRDVSSENDRLQSLVCHEVYDGLFRLHILDVLLWNRPAFQFETIFELQVTGGDVSRRLPASHGSATTSLGDEGLSRVSCRLLSVVRVRGGLQTGAPGHRSGRETRSAINIGVFFIALIRALFVVAVANRSRERPGFKSHRQTGREDRVWFQRGSRRWKIQIRPALLRS